MRDYRFNPLPVGVCVPSILITSRDDRRENVYFDDDRTEFFLIFV